MFNPVLMGTVGDAELFHLWLRVCNEPESLSETEATRYHLLLRAFSNSFGALYSAHQDGTFPEANWRGFERNFGELLATPGGGSLIRSVQFALPEVAEQMRHWRDAVGGETRWTKDGFQLFEDSQ